MMNAFLLRIFRRKISCSSFIVYSSSFRKCIYRNYWVPRNVL